MYLNLHCNVLSHRKLDSVQQGYQEESERCNSLRVREEVLSAEISELRERAAELSSQLIDKNTAMAQREGVCCVCVE